MSVSLCNANICREVLILQIIQQKDLEKWPVFHQILPFNPHISQFWEIFKVSYYSQDAFPTVYTVVRQEVQEEWSIALFDSLTLLPVYVPVVRHCRTVLKKKTHRESNKIYIQILRIKVLKMHLKYDERSNIKMW